MSRLTQLLPGGQAQSCSAQGLAPRELAPDLLVGRGLDHELGQVIADRCGSCCSASLIPWAGQQGEH